MTRNRPADEYDGRLPQIASTVARLADDSRLLLPGGFADRAAARGELEFAIRFLRECSWERSHRCGSLLDHALELERRFAAIDEALLRQLRAELRRGNLTLQAMKESLFPPSGGQRSLSEAGFDVLDGFIEALLLVDTAPPQAPIRPAEMVGYHPTPARIAFELSRRAAFQEADVFLDLGSGFGQVVMLVALLGEVPAVGVEIEPEYCTYARHCAASLGIGKAEFRNEDILQTDLTSATVFYLYTPLTGRAMARLAERLESEATRRHIRVFTYGPCSRVLRERGELLTDDEGSSDFQLALFQSRQPDRPTI